MVSVNSPFENAFWVSQTRLSPYKCSTSLPVLEVTLFSQGLAFWSTCGQFITIPSTGTNPTYSTQVQHHQLHAEIKLSEVHLDRLPPLFTPLQIAFLTTRASESPPPASCHLGRGLESVLANHWPDWSSSSSCRRCYSECISGCQKVLHCPVCRGGLASCFSHYLSVLLYCHEGALTRPCGQNEKQKLKSHCIIIN